MPDAADRSADRPSDRSGNRPGGRLRVLSAGALVAGAVVVGIGVWLLSRPGPGWTAVAPLGGHTYQPGPGTGTVATVLAAGGVLLVVGVAGTVVARRRRLGGTARR